MSHIYSKTNRIKFTDIAEKYLVPKQYKAKQCSVHSALIVYVSKNFRNTKKYRCTVVNAINILTYCVLENEVPPFDWKLTSPFETMPDIDMSLVESKLGDLLLTDESIEWDVSPSSFYDSIDNSSSVSNITAKKSLISKNSYSKPTYSKSSKSTVCETPKEDLYIQPIKYPRFDYNKPWLSVVDGDDKFAIYSSIPEIPSKQSEITVTTDVNKMTDAELLKLYPDHFIRTRASVLYEKIPGVEFDDKLGSILPISGFNRDQIIDNIIRYPHFYKLKRLIDDEAVSFYEDIEIDGELFSISSVWDSLPESKIIPKQSDYIKEYIVRRYILEEENGMKHNHKMYGLLLPYLTLFMPYQDYIERGYKDVVEISRCCVRSRVAFKQSRNPVLRRLGIDV